LRLKLTAGTKFVLLHSLGHPVDELLKRVYEVCELLNSDRRELPASRGMFKLTADSDAVMKNPFHTPEMPINSSQFESRLQTLIATANA
jgi:hypothetical protein